MDVSLEMLKKTDSERDFHDYEQIVSDYRQSEYLAHLFFEYVVKKHCSKNECLNRKCCLKQIKSYHNAHSKAFMEDSELLNIII